MARFGVRRRKSGARGSGYQLAVWRQAGIVEEDEDRRAIRRGVGRADRAAHGLQAAAQGQGPVGAAVVAPGRPRQHGPRHDQHRQDAQQDPGPLHPASPGGTSNEDSAKRTADATF